MSAKRRNIRKLKRDSSTEAAKLVTLIDGFIERKYLVVESEKYHVVMLDDFWKIFETEERQHNFLHNLQFYCSIMNAYNGRKVDFEAVLLISLKIEGEETKPTFYYKNKTIAYVTA